VLIELFNKGTSLVDFASTDALEEEYTFSSIEPGDYGMKENHSDNYPKNMRDGDSSSDGDAAGLFTTD
jgi:hypothetical protein